MKSIIKYFALFVLVLFSISQTEAKNPSILVLPVDIVNSKQNYYAFDNVSEIVSDDVIANLIKSGKVNSIDIYLLREKMFLNPSLKSSVDVMLKKYKASNNIDYNVLKKLSETYKSDYVLLISAYAKVPHSDNKLSLWDVLDVSSYCNLDEVPVKLNVSVVLVDTSSDLVVYSNNFTKNVGNNDNHFAAKNYAQASANYENIRFYSKNLVSKDISQNIILRLYPKTIRTVDKKSTNNFTGETLRYERNIPASPRLEKAPQPKDADNYGEMILGI